VKQVFYGFRDRTETMSTPSGQHQLGLLSFDCDIEIHLGLTSSFDAFEEIIDDIEGRGSTSIYSAISDAIDMLRPVFKAHPETDLRVLCLTDGENNGGIGPEETLEAVNSIGAVVDAIIVGDTPDQNLRKIVTATEGECFQITTLSEGFQLMEGEGVISLSARRGGVEKPKFVQRQKVDFTTVEAQTITRGADASAKTTSNKRTVTGNVMALNTSSLNSQYPTSAVSTSSKTLKRIMRELRQVAEGDDKAWMHTGEGVHIFPDEKDITKMRVLIQGPVGTPFEGGTFLLNVFVPSSYPFKPPNITFETPIYHCNVSESGQICMDILQSGWNPAMSIPKALECIRTLMARPSADNALRQWVAEEVLAYEQHGDTTADGRRYLDNAKKKTFVEASRSVDEWKALWNLIDQV